MESTDLTLLTFSQVVTNKINQSLNQIKKELKQYVNQSLYNYYIDKIKEDKQETFSKSINILSNAIGREVSDGDSGISQLLQLTSVYVDTYNDIQSLSSDRDQAYNKIQENVKKVNREINRAITEFENKIKMNIDRQVFNFEPLIEIKGVGWKTLSDLYLALDDNTSSDEPYVQGYLEFEIFRKEADHKQRLWLTYREIRKPLFEIINDGIDSYDAHEVTTIANQTIDSILSNKRYVKHIHTSALSQEEPCYASMHIYNQFYDIFSYLSNKINQVKPLIGNSESETERLESIIQEVENENGFPFTIEQKQAIYASCQHSVFSLTGLAGTGKSTSVKAIVRIYEKLGFTPNEIMGTSFTGQATYNLRQSVKLNSSQCATMHRWLMCNIFLPKDKLPVPSFDDVKLVIIDEFSMVGLELMGWVLSALQNNKDVRILFVGDIGQLPSIDLGFAYDFTQSELGQQIELTQVVRQGEDSIVPQMANDVRQNKLHDTLNDTSYKGKNFRFLSRVGHEDMITTASKSYVSFENKHDDLSQIQIIANTINIVNAVNNDVQRRRLNNNQLIKKNYLYNDMNDEYFYTNDRVIITKNLNIRHDGNPKYIFNGAKGTIKDVQFTPSIPNIEDNKIYHTIGNMLTITIQFDSDDLGEIKFELSDSITKHMKLAYATSIHKSQGSTISNVIMVVGRADMLNSAELVYTGMTRTSNTLTLISSANIIKKAIDYSSYADARTIYQDVLKSINQSMVEKESLFR